MAPISHTDFVGLKDAELFLGLDAVACDQILFAAEVKEFAKEEFIFLQAERADRAYCLLSGQVKLLLNDVRGNQVTVQQLSAYETFALLGVYGETNYPISAQAVVDSLVASWDVQILKALFEEFPKLATNGTRIITGRSLQFQSRILELSTEKVDRRIAHAILRLAKQVGEKTEQGICINLKLRREDVAELSGTTVFTSSRTLSKWEKEGIVRWETNQILISDPHKLVDIAEDLPGKYKSLID